MGYIDNVKQQYAETAGTENLYQSNLQTLRSIQDANKLKELYYKLTDYADMDDTDADDAFINSAAKKGTNIKGMQAVIKRCLGKPKAKGFKI